MGELSTLALKRIIRETGARASRKAARELARSVEEIAREIAERSKDLAEHAHQAGEATRRCLACFLGRQPALVSLVCCFDKS